MGMKQISYKEARKNMKPGDVIAFSGSGDFAEITKFVTRSNVSHIGTILQTKVVDQESSDRYFNQIIESTKHDGVEIYRASERINRFDNEVWWLPLDREKREKSFDSDKFFDFLFNQVKENRPYDMLEAVKSAVDILDRYSVKGHKPGYNNEDFSKFFCSELVAAGLEASGMVPRLNASEVTPSDLCSWNIFEADYYLLKGNPDRSIKRYNSADPSYWDI